MPDNLHLGQFVRTCFQLDLECSSKENLVDVWQTEYSEPQLREFEGISQLPQCSGTTSFDNQI